jgi:hypothetical protein
MDTLTNYSISGKFRFDSSNAEFGVSFYSQWPDDDKKYSLVRNSDGYMKLYYDVDGNRSEVGATDSAVAASPGVWFNYHVRVETTTGTENEILANVWEVGTQNPRDYDTPVWMIDAFHNATGRPEDGIVGVVSDSGTGVRYWAPMTVTSNYEYPGAHMAYETFRQDTIADISPYTPENWHSPSAFRTLPAEYRDSSGFVLRVTATDTSMVYRDNPGSEQPAISLLGPYTNLKWRDYELTGTIVKPAGDVYDSIEVGFVFYYENEDSYYKLVASGKPDNAIKIKKYHDGNTYTLETAGGTVDFEGSVNTVKYAVQVSTWDIDTSVIDGRINIKARAWEPGESVPDWSPAYEDTTATRKVEGLGGAVLDPKSTSLIGNVAATPVDFRDVVIRRVP